MIAIRLRANVNNNKNKHCNVKKLVLTSPLKSHLRPSTIGTVCEDDASNMFFFSLLVPLIAIITR